MGGLPDFKLGHGSGSSLPLPVLALAGTCTIVAVVVSGISIWLQLRNYRKPFLQRMVVRIMVMVPIYGVSSLISLFSLEAAFFIDAIRDIYEAFVIYCFFVLLLDYLGGERSLLILLHGRPPIPAVFPASLWRSDIDSSDPYTFLFLKRGILQYVQVKPLLAIASLIMKATGTYHEGDFRAKSGYLYVSIVYNISICLALWCLAVFWMCVHQDLKPFRPVPKFLCVKGILFFSFWQSIGVSFLVAIGVITRLGPYTDSEHISLGLTDTLICIEMPFFAAAHMYAFSYRDFIKPPASAASKGSYPMYVARMTLGYALKDACGLKDLVEDTRTTLRGEGINYRAFEPSEGGMHIGAARERRIRAGLRYAAGGKRKYWLPEVRGAPVENDRRGLLGRLAGQDDSEATAPLFATEADDLVHDAPDMRYSRGVARVPGDDNGVDDEDEYALTFGDSLAGPDGVDEVLYEQAKNYVFGDYLYPVVDVSSEEARRVIWEEEERVVREITSVGFARTDSRTQGGFSGYGATQNANRWVKQYEEDEEVDGLFKTGTSSSGHEDPRPSMPPSPLGSVLRSKLHTPSPPRSRRVSDCPPITSGSRTSSHQSHSHSHSHSHSLSHSRSHSSAGSSRLHLHVPSASPQGAKKKSSRTPLVEEDAVDLVVAASDELQVPSVSGSRGSRSPHSPALIRVWDDAAGVSTGVESLDVRSGDIHGGEDERDTRLVITVEEAEAETRGGVGGDEGGVEEGVVRVQTPPPYAQLHGYGSGIPEEEDNHNPWA